jgi:hypothetical protein
MKDLGKIRPKKSGNLINPNQTCFLFGLSTQNIQNIEQIKNINRRFLFVFSRFLDGSRKLKLKIN